MYYLFFCVGPHGWDAFFPSGISTLLLSVLYVSQNLGDKNIHILFIAYLEKISLEILLFLLNFTEFHLPFSVILCMACFLHLISYFHTMIFTHSINKKYISIAVFTKPIICSNVSKWKSIFNFSVVSLLRKDFVPC